MSTPLQEASSLSPLAKDHLLAASRWGKLFGTVLVVMLSIVVLFVLILIFTAFSAMSALGDTERTFIIFGSVLYAGFIGFLIFVYYQLIGFGNKVKDGLHKKDNALLEAGFGRLSTHFRFMSIMIIISFVLLILPLLLWFVFGNPGTLFKSTPTFPDGNF
ncbi:MAG: hypothetical protein IPN29_19885 [Saprospiraceae bacterium]|nr:hypothetical protein [Saprospiraceae bacterium]